MLRGTYVRTEEHKSRMSNAKKGHPNLKLRGFKHSEETKRKIGNANRNRIWKEESRKKVGAARKGKECPLETRKRMSELMCGENNPMFGRRHSKETKRNISLTLKGKNNPRFGKKVSEEQKQKIREARLHQVIPFKDTSIEVTLQNKLKELNIPFTKHKPITGQPDIFIEPNICIFADGDYWHKYPNGTKRDGVVTQKLTNDGYKVLRFWEHDINKNIDSCIQTIISAVEPKAL